MDTSTIHPLTLLVAYIVFVLSVDSLVSLILSLTSGGGNA
jgi:hypothetical protein